MRELLLHTSNEQKVQQAERELPKITAQIPTFNEEIIKKAIDRNSLGHPLEYPLRISQKKFNSLLELKEKTKEEKNTIPVVSDSVLAIRDEDGNWIVLNRDDEDEATLEKAKKIVERTGVFYFIGAVTFGVNQAYSILSYCKISVKPKCDLSFPLKIDSIPQIADLEKDFEVGYFDPNFNERPAFNTFNFDSSDESSGRRARPFISGLTKEVLKMAVRLGNFEKNIGERLKNLISRYPFNTLSFYALTLGFNEDELRSFYSNLFDTDFFKTYGGNCSLFSYNLAKTLEKLGNSVSIVIFPSKNPDKDNGHSGVLVELNEELKILLDPGLSIPYILPLSEIPLHYSVEYGNGKKAELRFNERGNLILVIFSPQTGEREFPVMSISSLEEFKNKAPEILLDLHRQRKIAKIDFHDENGKQKHRVIYYLDKKELVIDGKIFDNLDAAMEYLKNIEIPPYFIEHIISLLR